ncbi:hypothetical protein BKA83DRAFT_4302131 [Pisolithus microcarpus]|nr:hypothetical protein BKA83DRAFT_4302131 [Pisolithus microcarpus]
MDQSEIGRFGTLRLMKRVDPATPVAAFPIDDDTVTFGRDPTCSVRLYYSTISPVHAKLIFQDKKAFVVVLGQSGIHVDGCPVLPSQNPSLPTTIPVLNNTTLEIRGKRFVFTYPPKEMRTALYSSPSPTKNVAESASTDAVMTPTTKRKQLRMSMIRSAKVFTPRGKIADPVENLRILQTPLKRRGSSPLKQQYQTLRRAHNGHGDSDSSSDSDEDDENDSGDGNREEEEIVLVDGDHPHVVEEDKDLVILESVEVEVPQPSPPHSPRPQHRQRQQQQGLAAPPTTPLRRGAFGRPVNVQSSNPDIYQTPHRTPARPSLHRAVLIRSAQRVVLRQEIEQEEEEMEEKEVEEVIVDDLEDVDENEEDEDEEAEEIGQPSGWQKGLGLVKGFGWPFRSSSAAPEDAENHDSMDHLQDKEMEMDVDPHTSSADGLQTSDSTTDTSYNDAPPAHRSLGTFMTPQIPRVGLTTGVGRGAGRHSFGGALAPQSSSPTALSGPKRVRVEPKWKVTDIVVPMPSAKEETEVGEDLGTGVPHATPLKVEQEDQTGMGSPYPDYLQRKKLSEEEKQAIRERRRSALRTPDPYIGRYVPGMGPQHSTIHTQAPLPALFTPSAAAPNVNAAKMDMVGKGRSRSLSPVKLAMRLGSPSKVGVSIEERKGRRSESDEEEDTRSLLDRMKQTVEGLKRRRSEGALVRGGESGESGDGTRVDMGDGQETDARVDDLEEEDGKSDAGGDESDKENGGVRSNGGPMDVEATVEAHRTPDIDAESRPEAELPLANQDEDEDAPTDLPLPALTRPSSATAPQTPHLGPLKHLFSQPKQGSGVATPAMQSVRHLFKGVPISHENVQTPSMDGVRIMFLREERKGVETPVLEGVKEMMDTPEANAGEKGGGQDDGCDEHAHSAVPPTTMTRRRTPRLNANSGTPATEETVVLKPEESSSGGLPGQTVPPATTEGLPVVVPGKAKPMRGRKQTPVNDESNPSQATASSESKPVGGRKAKVESHPEAMPKRPPNRAKATPIPEVVAETKATRNEPVAARPRSRLGTTKVGQSSSSSVPATVVPTRGTRGGVRKGGGGKTSSGTDNARGRSGSGSGPRSGRSTPSETTAQSPVDEDDNDPLDTIGHAAKEDGPALKRRTRTAMTTKAKLDGAEGDVSRPAGRTRRAPTPSMVKPPATVAAAPPPSTRAKAGASTTRKRAAGLTATTQATPEVSSEVVDKENTPSRDDESTSGQDTSGNIAIVKTTTTTTRTRRGNTAGAKTKEGEKEGGSAKTGGVKTRTTRATTRSRT